MLTNAQMVLLVCAVMLILGLCHRSRMPLNFVILVALLLCFAGFLFDDDLKLLLSARPLEGSKCLKFSDFEGFSRKEAPAIFLAEI